MVILEYFVLGVCVLKSIYRGQSKKRHSKKMEEVLEDCTHACTSSCGKDKDCPCVSDHLCKNSPDYKKPGVEAIIDGIRWEGTENMLLAVLLARQEISKRRDAVQAVCGDCGGTGQVSQGQYDDIDIVPCICVKRALADARGNEKDEG